jgi:cystathionine beta-synthase
VVFLKRKLAEDVIKDHIDKPLIVARTEELVSHAIERMRNIKNFTIPVMDMSDL